MTCHLIVKSDLFYIKKKNEGILCSQKEFSIYSLEFIKKKKKKIGQ